MGIVNIVKTILIPLTTCFLFSGLIANEEKTSTFSKSWVFGDNLGVRFSSDTHFDYTENNQVQISAHLPGFLPEASLELPSLIINHHWAKEITLKQEENHLEIDADWSQTLPPDFIHLLYGAARLSWLKRGIFPVHAACVGNDEEGYVLLMGNPGSGKTSLTLNTVLKHGYKVFSGDKTLLRFNQDRQLEAIAGTRTITLRMEDVGRWEEISKEREQIFGDRFAFQLTSNHYSPKSVVKIKGIFLVGLNDELHLVQNLTSLSALHTLYPYFMDKQREDVLIGGDGALLDGTINSEIRLDLARNLTKVLENVSVYKAIGSLDNVSALIAKDAQTNITPKQLSKVFSKTNRIPKKILFGICGISNGHCSRQLPVMKHLLEQGHELIVFTYGDGLNYFNNRLLQGQQFTIIPVANPYFVGCPSGLDFKQTALSDKNQVDFNKINALAMHQASEQFGRPDLVISDYEMVAAQYAYAKNAPLITLDQQSKYLVGDFAPMLHGTSYIDEVERLGLFFPKAEKRIAVSFFKVRLSEKRKSIEVDVISPMIRPEVLEAKGHPHSAIPSILVYVTAQQLGDQAVSVWQEAIEAALPTGYVVHFFLPQRISLPENTTQFQFYHHGDKRFDSLLFASHGIVTTAGHNLLSEAIFLEKPVYALPLPLYEQQLNAQIIEDGGFGMARQFISEESLRSFFSQLDHYAENIKKDQKFLLKEPGNHLIIEKIDQLLAEQ